MRRSFYRARCAVESIRRAGCCARCRGQRFLPDSTDRDEGNRVQSRSASALVVAIGQVRVAPAPVFAIELFEKPVAAIEGDTPIHLATPVSSFLSLAFAGSCGMRKVLISFAPKSASMTRPSFGSRMVAWAAAPWVSKRAQNKAVAILSLFEHSHHHVLRLNSDERIRWRQSPIRMEGREQSDRRLVQFGGAAHCASRFPTAGVWE